MSPIAPARSERTLSAMTSIAVVGGVIVFLLATAGLLNMWLQKAPIPDSLRLASVVAHLSSVLLALPLGISQLLLPKGTFRHRTVGYVWIVLMVFTAIVSFAIHTINPHGLSPIHLFSVLTLVVAPQIVFFARTGRIDRHRSAVLGLMVGALAIAGLFTFLPGRALGLLAARLFGQT
jgi:uncharacterized membrane protein